MNDLTAQERQLILTLRQLRNFTLIAHKNELWRMLSPTRTRVGRKSVRGGIRERLG
jgi:hypothetical protein